jgi:hypothetical protein
VGFSLTPWKGVFTHDFDRQIPSRELGRNHQYHPLVMHRLHAAVPLQDAASMDFVLYSSRTTNIKGLDFPQT